VAPSARGSRGHPYLLLVQAVAVVEAAVLQELVAMVGSVEDERPVEQAPPPQVVEELADVGVREGDLAVVGCAPGIAFPFRRGDRRRPGCHREHRVIGSR
jgi:hypothetical protein